MSSAGAGFFSEPDFFSEPGFFSGAGFFSKPYYYFTWIVPSYTLLTIHAVLEASLFTEIFSG